jgi:hypothetical protein
MGGKPPELLFSLTEMSQDIQNTAIEQLKRQLDEVKAQVASGQIADTGEIHELLRGSAANFRDAYAVHQTNDDRNRRQPVQYSPTVEEWNDFPSLIEKLHFLDTEQVGAALVTLHPDTPGLQNQPEKTNYELNGWVISIEKHRHSQEYMTGTLQADGAVHRSTDKKKGDHIFRMVVEVERMPSSKGLTADAAVKQYEALAKNGKVDTPIYATDKDVESLEHREFYQLPPECPVFPLPGNLLDATKRQLSGIHTPHMYVSGGFGTSFLLHKEDSDLVALNYLVAGERKIWVTIAPGHMEKFEACIANDLNIKEKNILCGQWVRHLQIYVSKAALDRHKIHYCLFAQDVNQVVFTFAKTYHQGFNTGINVAEAVNYGDKHWRPEELVCSRKGCGNYREGDAYEFREPGEDQILNLFDDPKLIEAEIQVPKAAKRSHTDVASSRRPRQPPPSNGIHKTAQSAKANNVAEQNASELPQAPAHRSRASTQRPVEAKARESQNPLQQSTRSTAQMVQPRVASSARAVQLSTPRKSSPTPSMPQLTSTERIPGPSALPPKSAVPNPAHTKGIPARPISMKLTPEHRAVDNIWENWELSREKASGKPPSFRPTLLLQAIRQETIEVKGHARFCTAEEESIIIKLITGFGGTESFRQLKLVIQFLRTRGNDKATEVSSFSRSAMLCRALDKDDLDASYISIRNRIKLAKFAEAMKVAVESARPSKKRERADMVAFDQLMKEAYPGIARPDDTNAPDLRKTYEDKYAELKRRFLYGKYWLAISQCISLHALFFFPSPGMLQLSETSIHKLREGPFHVFLVHCEKGKGAFLKEISSSISSVIQIGEDGDISISKDRLRLESITEASIDSLPDLSGDLKSLLYIEK